MKTDWYTKKFPRNKQKMKRISTDKPGNKRRYDRTRNRSWRNELHKLLQKMELFECSHVPDRRVGGKRSFIHSPKCW